MYWDHQGSDAVAQRFDYVEGVEETELLNGIMERIVVFNGLIRTELGEIFGSR